MAANPAEPVVKTTGPRQVYGAKVAVADLTLTVPDLPRHPPKRPAAPRGYPPYPHRRG